MITAGLTASPTDTTGNNLSFRSDSKKRCNLGRLENYYGQSHIPYRITTLTLNFHTPETSEPKI